MLRAVVVGAGAMGLNHARIYNELESVELVAVVDVDGEAADRVGRKYHTRAFRDLSSALEETSPHIVSVAVPTRLHEEVAVRAIEHGCHVLVEKPLALSVPAGRRIIEAAERAAVTLGVGHVERFNPAVVEIKRRLENNELGRIFKVHARRFSPFPTRIGDVGVILDLATHDIDVIRHLLGSHVERGFAETQRRAHASCEDLVTALLRFENGVIGVLDVNWLTPTKVRELAILGERGMYVVDYLTQDLFWYQNAHEGGGWEVLTTFRGAWEGDMVKVRLNKKEPLRIELEDFVSSVVEGRRPQVSGSDGLAAIELGALIVESGQTKLPFHCVQGASLER
ncbi:MAG TPA: Gfo/Idh/MocA family oxidoreductase [Actinomycetota bacterium]|nr:Gfo/Idh/MocA family oxidoreductase [Actinomycetota bacterium]